MYTDIYSDILSGYFTILCKLLTKATENLRNFNKIFVAQ
jgi:hypothetical protein